MSGLFTRMATIVTFVVATAVTTAAWADDFSGKPANHRVTGIDYQDPLRSLPTSCDPGNCPRPGHPTQRCDGVDVVLGQLYGLVSYGRLGTYPNGESGFSCATTSCNNGCVRVGWHAPMQVDHPAILINVFRLADGRLTQIGGHFMKHGFYALSSNQCGYGCEGTSPGTELWIGCSDTYSAGNNASRSYLGPRKEWNPFKGVWDCVGSHFSGGQADCIRRHGSEGHASTDHYTRVFDEDLLTPGAMFFYDGYYVVKSDVNVYNSIGYRRTNFTWNGSYWTASDASSLTYGVVLNPGVWGDEHVTVNTGSGDLILGMTSSDNGDGTWHYEYAVYNLNYDRRVRSFSVPVSSTASVTGLGFHGPPLEEQSQAAWVATQNPDSCTWELDDMATPHNAIIYSSLYNFWFDVDAPPVTTTVTMEPYIVPGTPIVITAEITGPEVVAPPCGDFDGDGDVDLDDFGALAACYGGANNPPAAGCPAGVDADCDGDGDVDLDDFSTFASNYTGSQ